MSALVAAGALFPATPEASADTPLPAPQAAGRKDNFPDGGPSARATAAPIPAPPGTSSNAGRQEYAPDRVMVQFEQGMSLAARTAAATAIGGTVIADRDFYDEIGYSTIRVGDGLAMHTVERVQASPGSFRAVKFIEPVWATAAVPDIRSSRAIPQTRKSLDRGSGLYVPNDPLYYEQWYLHRMQLQSAWEFSTGGRPIASLDSGVADDHPDLVGKVVQGYNFYNRTYNTYDWLGHGTRQAGLECAVTDNSEGIASMAFSSPVMPLVVLSPEGVGYSDDIIAAILFAGDRVYVASMALANPNYDPAMQAAIRQAVKNNTILVAAMSPFIPAYPAAYDGVFAVGATNINDEHAYCSAAAPYIDVVAPGDDIVATTHDPKTGTNGYDFYHGTSLSCALTAALAAMLRAQHPDWTPAEVTWAMARSADRVGDGDFSVFGWGRLNACRAVRESRPSVTNIYIPGLRINSSD